MKDNLTYEESVAKLKEIVAKLEQGNVPLDDSIKLYDEALKLAKNCTVKLDDAKQKIIKIDEYLKEFDKDE